MQNVDTTANGLAAEAGRQTKMKALSREDLEAEGVVEPLDWGPGFCSNPQCKRELADKRARGLCANCAHDQLKANAQQLPDGRLVIQVPQPGSRAARRAVGKVNSPSKTKARRAQKALAKFSRR